MKINKHIVHLHTQKKKDDQSGRYQTELESEIARTKEKSEEREINGEYIGWGERVKSKASRPKSVLFFVTEMSVFIGELYNS